MLFVCLALGVSVSGVSQNFKVLVFSKTTGWRHNSIPAGISMVQQLGNENNFEVHLTEDANQFNTSNLAQYAVVIFLSTTGDILDNNQQAAFELYIQNGGGFVGIHSASDTEYDWPWYEDLVGAYFLDHPSGTWNADIMVSDHIHPSTANLPSIWNRTDEWYNFRTNPRSDVHVLATLEERDYTGGTLGWDHPIIWCHEYDGGRAWYTAGGHTNEAFSEPLFRAHVLGGIHYAAGLVEGDFDATVDANFIVDEMAANLKQPRALAILPNLDVVLAEKEGEILLIDAQTHQKQLLGCLDVYSQDQFGLLGLAIHPDFENNNLAYLCYSPAGDNEIIRVSEFNLQHNYIDLKNEHVLLEIPFDRSVCCNVAGDLEFDSQGLLYISIGDNVDGTASSGYAPVDERAGRERFDAQSTSLNSNDFRGKVLRIKPQNGVYTIPEGNLYATIADPGTPVLFEIYLMGLRNPQRIAVDAANGNLYVGDWAPGALNDDASRGPRGYEEINRATQALNFGWPQQMADNKSYRNFDFATFTPGDHFSSESPSNISVNNTGIEWVPQAQPAWFWYDNNDSQEFPEFERGHQKGAMAGAVYNYDMNLNAKGKFPEYYDGSLFLYDHQRSFFREVKQNSQGELIKINPFFKTLEINKPMDIDFGPDGNLYLLEWGEDGSSSGTYLKKIGYYSNSKEPVAKVQASVTSGTLPLEVQFDASLSYDPDMEALSYAWDFDANGTVDATTLNPSHSFTQAGIYNVVLTVSDPNGLSSSDSVSIIAGNTRPNVSIIAPVHGGFYGYGESISIEATAEDAEDGMVACEDLGIIVKHFLDGDLNMVYHIDSCEGNVELANIGVIGRDRTILVEASYQDQMQLTGKDSVMLQPKLKQAEHYSEHSGVSIEQSDDPQDSSLQVTHISNLDYLVFEPVNLSGITHLSFRLKNNGGGGRIYIYLDDLNSNAIGQLWVEGGGDFWDDYIVPVSEYAGTHKLYIQFITEFKSQQSMCKLNSISFHGIGISDEDACALNGLKGHYFNNTNFAGPAEERKDPFISFNTFAALHPSINNDQVSARWTGSVKVDSSATYYFTTRHENGTVRLSLNNELLIESSENGVHTADGVDLDAGESYNITLEYIHTSGKAQMVLAWNPQDAIDKESLFTETAVVTRSEIITEEQAPSVFPNPLVHSMLIKSQNVNEYIKSVKMLNAAGIITLNEQAEKATDLTKVSTKELEDGLYYLLIETNKKVYTMKVLKTTK